MKTDTLIIAAAAAAGVGLVYVLTRGARGAGAGGTSGSRTNNGSPMGANEIPNPTLPGSTGYGWRYFTDGTSIDPLGNYYQGGNLVYSNTSGAI